MGNQRRSKSGRRGKRQAGSRKFQYSLILGAITAFGLAGWFWYATVRERGDQTTSQAELQTDFDPNIDADIEALILEQSRELLKTKDQYTITLKSVWTPHVMTDEQAEEAYFRLIVPNVFIGDSPYPVPSLQRMLSEFQEGLEQGKYEFVPVPFYLLPEPTVVPRSDQYLDGACAMLQVHPQTGKIGIFLAIPLWLDIWDALNEVLPPDETRLVFQDIVILVVLHEYLHLIEDPLGYRPSTTIEEMALGEIVCWAKTGQMIVEPMRSAGRGRVQIMYNPERQITIIDNPFLASAIFRRLGYNVTDSRWNRFVRQYIVHENTRLEGIGR
jgi:hypothetical protein